MNKIQLRPPPPGPKIKQAYASPPCLMPQVESSVGYWIRDEELVFLNELLALKRKVAETSGENGKGADRRIAEIALEMRLLQASLYDFLREQIRARGGQAIVGSLGKKAFKEAQPKLILMQAIAVASRGRGELVEANQKAPLKVSDPQLRVAPAAVRKLHHKNEVCHIRCGFVEANEGSCMSHIAIRSDDPRNRGGLVGFYPDGDVIAGRAIHPRTAPAAQTLAALGEMTSGIAHDFRNVLTVIGSAIKMAEMSASQPERACACLAGAREGIERGLKLTSELLMFATHGEMSEAGAVGVGLHDVNVFLKKLERLLKYAAGPGVRVVLELAPDIPNCVIDPSRFDVAMLNLVVNARDAMSGAGEIQISTQLCSEPGVSEPRSSRSFVRVRVKDNGEGMTSDVVQKIFDPFFTTKGAKGTGLGLPQVHEFVRQVRGHMGVASERGVGTVIDLFFTLNGCGESSSLARRESERGPVVGASS